MPMPEAGLSTLQRKAKPVLPVIGRQLFVKRKGRVLIDIDEIVIAGGGTTVIVGPNGAGKSLLLKLLAGLRAPDTGEVSWNGEPPSRSRYCRFGMVLQHAVLLRRSALSNVIFGLKAVGHGRKEAEKRAEQALRLAGLERLATASARVLSGGERQRLALARAMAAQPDLLFLDEPTASLDPASVMAIESMVTAANGRGMRTVMVAHDLAQAKRVADEIILMHNGHIVERAGTVPFFERPRSATTSAFIAGEILL